MYALNVEPFCISLKHEYMIKLFLKERLFWKCRISSKNKDDSLTTLTLLIFCIFPLYIYHQFLPIYFPWISPVMSLWRLRWLWYECRYTTKMKLATFELCGISYFHSFVSRHDDSCLNLNSWWYQYIIQSQSQSQSPMTIRFTLVSSRKIKEIIQTIECPQSITITSGRWKSPVLQYIELPPKTIVCTGDESTRSCKCDLTIRIFTP